MKRVVIVVITLLLLVILSWNVGRSATVHQWWYDLTKPKLPVAENIGTLPVSGTTTNRDTQTAINAPVTQATVPPEKNLAVPFTTQAPGAKWDADHEEFCEEATVIMAGRFFRNQPITSTADAEAALQRVKQWELDHLGFYFDTTAEETASIIRDMYGLTVTLKVDPTITDIKQALANDQLVIVPAAGRELGNPNFPAPGPIYHNLLLRGYTKSGQFITNDPGTRKGEGYVYSQAVVMAAMHDWVPSGSRTTAANGDANGQKVVLIVSR